MNPQDLRTELSGIVRGTVTTLRRATRNAAHLVFDDDMTAHRTPHQVVDEAEMYRLRHYRGDQAAGPVVLMIPPLMVTPEVYDIAPRLSAVEFLSRSCDPWVVDFGVPEETPGGHTRDLADHIRAVDDAITSVAAETDREVHLVGYSQGGLFCYQAAALRDCQNVRSVITFGSPVDLHQNLPAVTDPAAARRVFETLRAGLDVPLEEFGRLPSWLTSRGFKLLNPLKEIAYRSSLLLHLHDTEALKERAPKRRFLDGEGFVDWPGPALRDFLKIVLEENRMANGGFSVGDRKVSLDRIDCPVLYFAGKTDDFARLPAVSAIESLAPRAQVRGIDVDTGHFGLVVGSTSMNQVWPRVAQWLQDHRD